MGAAFPLVLVAGHLYTQSSSDILWGSEDLKLLLKSQSIVERTGQHSQMALRHSNRRSCSWERRDINTVKETPDSAFCLHNTEDDCLSKDQLEKEAA